MDWHRYHRLPTIYAYLRRLERDYPDLVEIVDIGKSTEGRSLLLAKVGKKQKYDKPGIFIEGGLNLASYKYHSKSSTISFHQQVFTPENGLALPQSPLFCETLLKTMIEIEI